MIDAMEKLVKAACDFCCQLEVDGYALGELGESDLRDAVTVARDALQTHPYYGLGWHEFPAEKPPKSNDPRWSEWVLFLLPLDVQILARYDFVDGNWHDFCGGHLILQTRYPWHELPSTTPCPAAG